jgi:hypothetical protein
MSPSEGQLRAALHEGEGDAPDPGALIEHAVGVRRERRRRVYLAAGAAVVVAAIGVGVGVLSGNGPTHTSDSAGGGQTQRATARPSAAGAPNGANPRVHGASSAAAGRMSVAEQGAPANGCPPTAARYLLPGGGGSGQFGASEPLFSHDVSKILVCGYPAKASEGVRALVLRGGDAGALAASFESAPSTHHSGVCTSESGPTAGTVELLATDANGVASKPVVITLGCPTSMATNGTAVRYLATLPSALSGLLDTSATKSPNR